MREGSEPNIYQTFEIMAVDRCEEGNPLLEPYLSATSVMVATEMLKNRYKPRKGLGTSLHGITEPLMAIEKKKAFVLGFKSTPPDEKLAKNHK